MNIKDIGVIDDMLKGITDGTFVMTDGYKTLTHEEIINILKASM